MNKEKKLAEKVPRPQLVKLDTALKLSHLFYYEKPWVDWSLHSNFAQAEKWVSEMSQTSDNGSTNVELEGRPLRLGLGAKVPRKPNVGPINDPVERKLRASLGMGKRKANESIEKPTIENVVEGSDVDEEDENLDSRSKLFAKKKSVQPLNPTLRANKK